MKIIFLDIDGVLNKGLVEGNSRKDDILRDEAYGFMNKSLVNNLNKLTQKTGAKIVISSSWRCETLEENEQMLKAFGIEAECVGSTPRLSGPCIYRGNEIEAWIYEYQDLIKCHYWEFKEYIILDDDSDMLLSQAHHFIQTDPWSGLSDAVTYKAINRLNSLQNLSDTFLQS